MSATAAVQAREAYLGPIILPAIPADRPAKPAYDAYHSGRSTAAQEMARPLAEKGDGDALFLLGFATEAGETRAPSRMQSMLFSYRKGAAQGSAEAPWRLALTMWEAGRPEERTRAQQQIETAANQGNPRACRIYAEAWQRGLVDRNPDTATAMGWWKKAAEGGDVDAYVPLGALLLVGNGPSRDEAAAQAWLRKALGQKNSDAFLVLGDDAEKVKTDPAAALTYFRQGAEAGQTDCMLRLANRLLADAPAAGAEGVTWLKKSADAGNPRAALQLGNRMQAEHPENLPAAYHYLLAAAKDGVWQAQYQVAMILLDGKLGESDPVAAVAWLLQAIVHGDPGAQFKLATLNEAGIGGPANFANANILYNLATTKGHAEAPERLARMSFEGLRVVRSNSQAWAYATLAVTRGNQHANSLLDEIESKLTPEERTEGQKALAELNIATAQAQKLLGSPES